MCVVIEYLILMYYETLYVRHTKYIYVIHYTYKVTSNINTFDTYVSGEACLVFDGELATVDIVATGKGVEETFYAFGYW